VPTTNSVIQCDKQPSCRDIEHAGSSTVIYMYLSIVSRFINGIVCAPTALRKSRRLPGIDGEIEAAGLLSGTFPINYKVSVPLSASADSRRQSVAICVPLCNLIRLHR